MRIARVALAILAVLVSASLADAKCDASGADAADVAAARTAVAAACDCAGAVSHGAYVHCADSNAQATLANEGCVGAVVRCATRSTCGRPNAIACCQTRADGVTLASIKGSVRACRVPAGGSRA